MRGVFLLLGTNLANREQNLATAIAHIEKKVGKIGARSSIYETAAWGVREQPDFLNQVINVETSLPAEKILEKILAIEAAMGRKRFEKWGSRLIDIDILFYNDEFIDSPDLKIPHPEFKNRNFALAPMAEIAPEEFYPGTRESMKFLAGKSPDKLPVWRSDK